jgi:hypothetical protein
MSTSSDYTPPKVWAWNKANGGRFANINRPVAGATHAFEGSMIDLPVVERARRLLERTESWSRRAG